MSIYTILSSARVRAARIRSRLDHSLRHARLATRNHRRSRRRFFVDDGPLGFELPEMTFMKVGFVLISIYLLLRVDGVANASRDLSWFDEGATDTSLWSDSRVELYRSAPTPPPEALVGALIVRSLDLRAPIYSDTREVYLNRGVGVIDAMARPGDVGNAGIAGHRDGHFRVLKDIKTGDVIEIVTWDRVLRYRVQSIDVVEREDVSLLRTTPSQIQAQTQTLTLVTCFPFYFVGRAPLRYIVRSELVSSQDRSSVTSYQMEPRRPI